MSFDLSSHLGAMSRVVSSIERDGKPAKAVVAWRSYETDAADVWDAITRPERLARWFGPVSGDLRPGGRFQVEGNAGGSIVRCEPPRSLELTWENFGQVSWVSVKLTAEGAGTRLTLEHVAHVPDEVWQQFGPGGVGVGWEAGLYSLGRHLSAPERFATPPEQDPEWMRSTEAADFFRMSSEGWGKASIAAGTPQVDAMAAAERVRGFFSGAATGA